MFDRNRRLAAVLQKGVAVAEVVAFYETYVRNAATRRKFSSRFAGAGAAGGVAPAADGEEEGEEDNEKGVAAEGDIVAVPVSVEEETRVSTENRVNISSHIHFKRTMALLPITV